MFVDDSTRLHHMLEAAREAMAFVHGRTRADLDTDRQLALSLVKCIEIVGEAASGISQPFRRQHPEVPWRAIVAMRNRLIHGYFDIDHDRVWDTVKSNLPALVASLERILNSNAGPAE